MPQRRFALVALGALSVATFPYLVTADGPGDKPAVAKPADGERPGPLPNYFGKIAVNDAQRADLYKVQDEYDAKIDALQMQIKALLKERDSKMEALLTPGQKLRLQELRDEAKAKGAKPDDEAPKTDAPAK
jgi:Spy/CpxP family protein refolding chaperone